MKYVELFAGIGGFRSALDTLGMECVFASEIDKYATTSYKTLYGGEELHGDITKIEATDIPNHDLLVGGFPCQAFSLAGLRQGFEDARGTLFFDIARIASEKRPNYLLLENVKGLLSHDGGKTFATMCSILNQIGYAIDFAVLNSKYFGVPQSRERVFIVASRNAEHSEWEVTGNDVVAKTKRRIQENGVRSFNFPFPKNNVVEKRLRDVLETDVAPKFYLTPEKTATLIARLNENPPRNSMSQQFSDGSGISLPLTATYCNSISPADVGKQKRTHVMTHELTRNEIGKEIDTAVTLLARDYKGLMNYPMTGIVEVNEPELECVGRVDVNGHDFLKRVYNAEGLSPTIETMGGGNREPKIAIREATKTGYAIAEEGDSINFTQPNSETRRGRVGKQIANTLEVSCNQAVIHEYKIRKLTPRECFRLQGFTDEQFDKLIQAKLSDTQLYKQAGNAVTVNVIDALGKALLAYDIQDSQHDC
ncbi:Dcm Site-specific DNA methylase [uncultured Caudovirales phage]|uniref:Cytosine-specific methyltransferase n=1 Tax=uncultured Caudovirales phage TaxID=2100421 RepID=A0A6J5MFW7_9CAUD|nr:Dcm Site-specific DNA methylase [uncultured Caudovirales phage]